MKSGSRITCSTDSKLKRWPNSASIVELSPEIRTYYEEAPEAERLAQGPARLEFERTKQMLAERLPRAPAVVLDIGGGPGPYALWLAQLGYDVHLIDPVACLVSQAQQQSDEAVRHIASCNVGDARDLKSASNSADAVLELGPLYHLIHRVDRLQALKEAFRVLKPGGTLFV